MESKVQSSPSFNRSFGSCDRNAGSVAPADSRYNIRDCCPEECSPSKLSGLCVCSSSSGLLPNHLILGVRGRFLFVCLCICIKVYTMKKGARRFH